MSAVISVANQKGGVGKTTLTVHLAYFLAVKKKKRVLLVDADPQGSARDWAAARKSQPPFVVVAMDRPTIHRDLAALGKDYDFVIVDAPPRVSDITRSALIVSDLVLIPVQPSPFDIWAAQEVINLIKEASVFKENLKSAFVINRKIVNTAIGRDAAEALTSYQIPGMRAQLCQRVAFPESANAGQTVTELQANSPAALEVKALVKEVLEVLNNGQQASPN